MGLSINTIQENLLNDNKGPIKGRSERQDLKILKLNFGKSNSYIPIIHSL